MKDTLKQIEEAFDEKFLSKASKIFRGGKFISAKNYPDGFMFTPNRVKSFIKSSIIKVLQQLVERENKVDLETGFNAQYNDQFHEARGFHSAKQDTISYLKSEIATLSTNIDKE